MSTGPLPVKERTPGSVMPRTIPEKGNHASAVLAQTL
jgi:hypothetical protein